MAEEDMNELKKLITTKRLIYGTDRTIKGLKQGKIEKVFLSSNCKDTVKQDIEHYGKLSKANVATLNVPNDELRIIVKKPYAVSVIGVIKA